MKSLPGEDSPLHGRYLATNSALRLLLAASDAVLAPLRPRRPRPIDRPRRVLLSINGHLGDAVIATAAIGVLAAALPGAELGIVLPSWSRPVFDSDPRIRHIHLVDHWHTSRASRSLPARWLAYRLSRRRAVQEIRRVGYDAAVDLYDYFPNAALLLWRAGIPTRIGFDVAGFSALYTHAIPWPDDERHVAQRHLLLLRTLVPTPDPASMPRPQLAPAGSQVAAAVDDLLAHHGLQAGSFVVMHVGAGDPEKALSPARWRALAEDLVGMGATLVFTGRGTREHDDVRAVSGELPRCVDLCDALAWPEFVHVIRLARAVVSVDTVAGHVAAAVGTLSITFWTSRNNRNHWRPLGDSSAILDDDQVASLGELRSRLVPPSVSPHERHRLIETLRDD